VFKVKATVIRFAGDEVNYPCHFGYKIGDEIVFDGEKFIGRICLQLLPLLDKFVHPLFCAGPRYIDPAYYLPFWYSPANVREPANKIYDGLGMRIVKENITLPKYHVANFSPPTAFKWPPAAKRDIRTEITGRCDDLRTAVTFKFEAFDLADLGDAIPYFRKEMVILNYIIQNPGVKVDKIRESLPKAHLDEIYPGLYPILFEVLVEELEVIGLIKIEDGKATATPKGAARLTGFKASITPEEIKAVMI
jgi:hypothetical protein